MADRRQKTSARLVARTTLRLEALSYVEDLFPDDTAIIDHSGWKLLLSRDFDGSVTADDISAFVDEVSKACADGDPTFVEFDKAHVCTMLFTKFRCTLDEQSLGFILKSKTVVEPVMPPPKKRFFLVRLSSWLWKGFRNIHNGILESLKIG